MTSAKPLRKPRVEYSEEIAEEILGRIADGEFLTRICSDPKYPYRETIERWRHSIPGFGEMYKEARNAGFDERAERALLALHDTPGLVFDESGRSRIDPGWVQLVKVRFWGEMEALKRWDPERYGEKIAVNHGAQASLGAAIEAARERLLKMRKDREGSEA